MFKDGFFSLILKCICLLGLVVAVIGVVMLVLWLCTDLIDVPGTSKMKILGLGEVETLNVFFVTVLGCFISFASVIINYKYGPRGKVERQETIIPRTAKREEGGYSIAEKHVTIDLTNRRKMTFIDHFASQLSETERTTQIIFKNPDALPDTIDLKHATSGHSIIPITTPNNAEWHRIEEESEQFRNPFFSTLAKSSKLFNDLILRKGKMISYYLTIHREYLKEHEIKYKLKYNNAFVGNDFDWVGEHIVADIDLLTIKILFPEKKHFKSCHAYMKDTEDERQELLPDPDIEIKDDHSVLIWTVKNTRKGQEYVLEWTW